MDIGHLFTRSLELMWRYKFLWLFAFVMGLTSAGVRTPDLAGSFNRPLNPITNFRIEPFVLGLAVVFGAVMLAVWALLVFLFRFIARGAMVDTVRAAEAQTEPTLRDAWQSGRKFYTRLLGLGLLVNAPLALVSVSLILLGLLPFIGVILAQRNADGLGARALAPFWISGFLAFCGALACLAILSVVIHPFYEMAVRAIVVEDLSVRAGVQRGIQRVRAQVGNVLTVYLVLIGARFGYGMVVGLVSIPFGAVIALGVFGLWYDNLNALFLMGLAAAPFLWLFFGALEGVFQLFESNVWTEAYLTMAARDSAAPPE